MAIVKKENAEGGSDAKYDVTQMTPEERAMFDPDGRPLGNDWPDQWTWTPGLPGARGGTGPGSPGGGGGGGGGGDLLSTALNSPWYQQALAASQAAEAADAAFRKQAIQQMLIQFGIVPANFNDQYGDIDQTTRDLAAANTNSGISAAARLQQALKDANTKASRELAARGLRRSGEKGYQLRRNQLGYDQSYSDAVQKLLGGAASAYQGFAQNQYGRQMSLAQALQSAINNMSTFGGYRPSSSTGGGWSAPSGALSSGSGWSPSESANPWNEYTGNTIGSGTQGGYGTAYGPAAPGQGGGFTSPQKPLLYA